MTRFIDFSPLLDFDPKFNERDIKFISLNMGHEESFKLDIDNFGFSFIEIRASKPDYSESISPLRAIIDTGAHTTHIKKGLIELLGLDLFDTVDTLSPTANNVISQERFLCTIHFSEDNGIKLPVKELSESYPSDLIIGIDVLKFCKIAIDYKNKKGTLDIIGSNP